MQIIIILWPLYVQHSMPTLLLVLFPTPLLLMTRPRMMMVLLPVLVLLQQHQLIHWLTSLIQWMNQMLINKMKEHLLHRHLLAALKMNSINSLTSQLLQAIPQRMYNIVLVSRHFIVCIALSSSSCVTNTAPTSAVTTTTSSSQFTSPPPGMNNLPPPQPTPGVYNDGHGWGNPGGQSWVNPGGQSPGAQSWVNPGGQSPGAQSWGNPGGQSWGNPGGQNGAAINKSGTVLGGPGYCFSGSSRADSGYNGNHEPHPPRGRGRTPHTLATRSPHPGDFGTNQGGNSPTGMNYSGAVARQDTGAGAVTVQPQATGHAGIYFMYCT